MSTERGAQVGGVAGFWFCRERGSDLLLSMLVLYFFFFGRVGRKALVAQR